MVFLDVLWVEKQFLKDKIYFLKKMIRLQGTFFCNMILMLYYCRIF